MKMRYTIIDHDGTVLQEGEEEVFPIADGWETVSLPLGPMDATGAGPPVYHTMGPPGDTGEILDLRPGPAAMRLRQAKAPLVSRLSRIPQEAIDG